ncbi:MAG: HD domain-containing protein [Halobacteriaceae archaeon]
MAIKDSIHNHIELCELAKDLLDLPVVQRLRHIKQLSTVRLVYPSANHTRFEHSLGVYHLASRATRNLEVSSDDARAVRAAALLHDIGHGPYGHQTEPVIQRRLNRHHDEVSELLTSSRASDVLDDHGVSTSRIVELIAGEGALGEIVSGELDVDRADYLVRDAHHTGVPYGTIDHGRLLRAYSIVGDKLVLTEGNIATAESILVARALMNATVYRHHVSRIAGTMLERAVERLLNTGDVDLETFARMTDDQLMAALRECPDTVEMANRLAERRLFKRAIWASHEETKDHAIDLSHKRTRELEREIATLVDISADKILIDSPRIQYMPESSAQVTVDGEHSRLGKHSPLVEGLDAAARAQWRLGVYTPSEHRESVRKAAERVLLH